MFSLLRKVAPALAFIMVLGSVSPACAMQVAPTGPNPTPIMELLVLYVGIVSTATGLI